MSKKCYRIIGQAIKKNSQYFCILKKVVPRKILFENTNFLDNFWDLLWENLFGCLWLESAEGVLRLYKGGRRLKNFRCHQDGTRWGDCCLDWVTFALLYNFYSLLYNFFEALKLKFLRRGFLHKIEKCC